MSNDIKETCKRQGMDLTPGEIETVQEFNAREGEQNGKGDRPRNNTSDKYRENYDKIFKKRKSNIKKNIRKKTKD
jgi:hypothetical protein